MKEFLDFMMIKYGDFAASGNYLYTFGKNFESSNFWSYGFLQETCMGLFNEAYEAIEVYKETDYETYETLRDRITLDTFYVRYLLVNIYSYEYEDPTAVKDALIADMRRLGVGTVI